jgi:hypothetical protein
MYICICVYIYIYTHIHIHIYTCIYLQALFKVVGMWLIVDDDETASAIISNKSYAAMINGCVTLTGGSKRTYRTKFFFIECSSYMYM